MSLIVPLAQRATVRLVGSDATAIVHNLATIDGSGYCNFLSPQGRVLFDVFVAPTPDGVLLEVDRSIMDKFRKHVNMYKLRKDARLVDEEEFPHVVHVTGQIPDTAVGITLEDSRIPGAWRVYCANLDWSDRPLNGPERYQTRRYLRGVGEGVDELQYGKSFSLENNLDRQGGVSFDKGCYLGQELVARTHSTGVVRKRLMPVLVGPEPPERFRNGSATEQGTVEMLLSLGDTVLPGSSSGGGQALQVAPDTPLVNSKGKSGGRIIRASTQFPSLALAMVRLQHAGVEGMPLFLQSESGDERIPCWPLQCS